MALQLPPRTPIELPVANRQIGDTLIRQKARFQSFGHAQGASGECTILVQVLVRLYAADGDGYGPELTGAGFMPYPVSLVADNQTLVDAADGTILAIRTIESDEAWQALIDSFAQPTMLQGDFFEYLRDNGLPGTIRQLIEHHIQQANTMGRFA